MVVENVPLFEWKIFPMDSRRLCLRLVVSRRPFGAPLRASPVYPCISFPYGPIPRWDLNIGFQLCYRSRIQKYFPANSISIRLWLIIAVPEVFGHRIGVPRIEVSQEIVFSPNSISIGSRSTNGISRCLDLGFIFPMSRYPRKSCFRRTRFSLVPGRPMRFRGVWTPDSSFPYPITPHPALTSRAFYPCQWCSFDLHKKTDRHTDRQTFFSLDPPYSRGNHKSFPLALHTGYSVLFFALQLKIQSKSLTPSLPSKLNGNSCLPHRSASRKLVSRELKFHCFPVDKWVFEFLGVGFMFVASNYPCETPFGWGGVRVYRLPSNHCHQGATDPGFEFPTASYPPGSVFSRKFESIGCLATIVTRGQRTPDSSYPPRVTPESFQTSHS